MGAGVTAVIAAALAPGRRGPRARGVHHAGVTVSDFEAAVRWYHEHFGFLLVTEMTLEGESADQLAALYGRTGLTVRFGFMRGRDGSILEVFQFDPPEPASPAVWNRPRVHPRRDLGVGRPRVGAPADGARRRVRHRAAVHGGGALGVPA